MKPKINQELCIGCGTCEGICPEVFTLNDGKALIKEIDDYTAYAEKIQQAVEACPVTCINIEK